VADHHLEPPVALRHPELGRRRKLVAIEEVEAEGRVERHLLAGTAEQPPYRLAERLALDVPERDVDGRERLRAEAGLPARHQGPIELVPDALVRQRVVALDRRGDDPVDDLGNDRLPRDRRQTVADDVLIGLDLDEAGLERGFPFEACERDLQRDVEGGGGDASNSHGRRYLTTNWRACATPHSRWRRRSRSARH
jgi:hypothetical protein